MVKYKRGMEDVERVIATHKKQEYLKKKGDKVPDPKDPDLDEDNSGEDDVS